MAIITAGVLLAASMAAMAETCTLTLKRRETAPTVFNPEYMFWMVRPQYVYMQLQAEADGSWRPANLGGPSQTDAFKRIVTKEPKYQSEYPFRGVVKLGSQEFAFALDTAPPKRKHPEAKPAAKVAEEPGSVTTGEKSAANSEKPVAKPAPLKGFAYNRLYFDFNRNGDLTDDKVIEAPENSGRFAPILTAAMSYLRFEFPQIDVKIDVDGKKLDSSFYLDGYVNASYQEASGKITGGYCTVMASFNSAARREGDITLEGKRHHIVLIDFNSNGRFDDRSKVPDNMHLVSGQFYTEPGDMLLIDPKVGGPYDSPYDPTASDYRYYVSDMISIDGRWYDLKISPAGDELTLTRTTAPLGSVTNKNEAFRAIIYSNEKGFLKISGVKDKPVPVPEGEWKLLAYTITGANRPAPTKPPAAKPAGEAAENKTGEKHGSLLAGLSQLAETFSGGNPLLTGPTLVSATATEKCKPVTVRKGETVELPFGPPYTPTVTAMSYGVPSGQAEQLSLEMGLVGVAGEACTNMMVNGGRPGKPEFSIADPRGKIVAQGSFEYG